MKNIFLLAVLSFASASSTPAAESNHANASSKSYFIDVREFGAGKVTPAAVAASHRSDVAVQSKHDVRFIESWLDQENGRVYCLSEAKDAASIEAIRREAHGLLPARILRVAAGDAAPFTGSAPLFLDIHELGAGNVTAQAVAGAHEKDLQVQGQFGVRFINYWVDEVGGQVLCLSEAPGADAVIETHRQAHGLLPQSVVKVTKSD